MESLDLFIIPALRLILVDMKSICLFQVRLSSTIMPKYLVLCTLFITKSSPKSLMGGYQGLTVTKL